MASPLARRLGLFSLVVYGIGDILGAGIYALVGKVAAAAGPAAWLSFILAAVVAAVTGLSYAELASRFPVSAGAAAYVRQAFQGRLMATLAGVFVMGTGVVSAATVSVAFSGYLGEFVAMPAIAVQILLVAALSFLSFWGILESSRVNIALTAVELAGLLAVITAGAMIASPEGMSRFWDATLQSADAAAVLGGVTIAFFAFIGFEDLCNLAEEAKNPARDLPKAILTAIAVSTALYLAVMILLQVTVSQGQIAASPTPLLLILQQAGWEPFLRSFSVIAMLAIANTGLANLIMASRLIYGMAGEGLLPAAAGRVHARRKTPWVGVVVAGSATLALVLTGGLKILAQTTSLLILIVFLLVHLSLIRVKRAGKPHAGMTIPAFLPWLGCLLCAGLSVQFPAGAYWRSLLLLALGLAVWAAQSKPFRRNPASQPFPEAWRAFLAEHVPLYTRLPEAARAKLQGLIQTFLSDKNFEGCGGFEITHEAKLLIASQACLLLAGRDCARPFPALSSVLVYPSSFVVPQPVDVGSGQFVEMEDVRCGESWEQGCVVLAWDEITGEPGEREPAFNVIIHEFAHQLDQEEGVVEGSPFLLEEFRRLEKDLDRGKTSILDEYAASDPSEFFAVASESFFGDAVRMKSAMPALYAALSRYYRLDPAAFSPSPA